jgi:phosphate uptake regulator
MEQLRNYVQHRGIPVHQLEFGGAWSGGAENRKLEFRPGLFASKEFLSEGKTFKRTVLNEMPDRVDLHAAVLRYVECISTIHDCARSLVNPRSSAARKLIEEAHAIYAEYSPGKNSALAAIRRDPEGRDLDHVPLLLEWDDVRLELYRRNRRLVNVTKKVISNR